uniref:Uncharacterized protein n=1 Tax=Anguilla anguilla TaxID=7936 RepID=A0A0E9U201_ANGAN
MALWRNFAESVNDDLHGDLIRLFLDPCDS